MSIRVVHRWRSTPSRSSIRASADCRNAALGTSLRWRIRGGLLWTMRDDERSWREIAAAECLSLIDAVMHYNGLPSGPATAIAGCESLDLGIMKSQPRHTERLMRS